VSRNVSIRIRGTEQEPHYESQQIVEDRNRARNEPGNSPENRQDDDPDGVRFPAIGVEHMRPVFQRADIDIFLISLVVQQIDWTGATYHGDMAVNDTRNNDGG
jgi:hypothetical protein